MTDSQTSTNYVDSADIVLPCEDVSTAAEFYTDELGFRVESVFPADAPRIVVLSGYDLRLRLESIDPLVRHETTTPSLVITNFDQSGFGTGRAGMQYRDLIPDRFGGRFIASHIRISDGGPVPDYVHHHDIHFQMIFCVNGWVRVVYEDQGEPMLMEAGDCFLQPPHIRHRVLECSDQMEVVEIASPAEHETSADHGMELPTSILDRERDFSGQKFVFHKASQTAWSPSFLKGFELQDTGISNATDGVASVLVIKSTGNASDAVLSHDAGIRFLFVLGGEAVFTCESENHRVLSKGDSCAIPPGLACSLVEVSPDFRMLDVSIPSRQEGRSAR